MNSLARVVALVAVAAGSCSNITSFEIQRAIPQQTVPGNPIAHAGGMLLESTPFQPFALDVNLSAESQAHDTGPVQHVYLQSLTLTIQPTGTSDCWDFVDSITVSIESTRAGTSLPPTTIATASHPGCVQTVSLAPATGVDLQPYINEGARVTSNGRSVPPAHDVMFDGQIVLDASL